MLDGGWCVGSEPLYTQAHFERISSNAMSTLFFRGAGHLEGQFRNLLTKNFVGFVKAFGKERNVEIVQASLSV